jgi:cysteine desulfurase/selenocysteine lyase
MPDTELLDQQLAGVREDFPVLGRRVDGVPITYLDSAATALKPDAVIDAVVRYYREVGANIHRGKHMLSEEASEGYERARSAVAGFIGAAPPEVAFVANTTHGINLLAEALGLGPDDLVLCPLDNHHSHLLPWWRRARVEFAGLNGDATVDLDHYAALLRRRPRVVALTHCSNVTGVVSPVAAMAAMAREAGALVVLDAAQSAPHRELRVRQLGADAVVFSAHKMLGPTGVGVLWIAAERQGELHPAHLGGGTVDRVTTSAYELRRAPHRFEAGTPDIAGVLGLGAAVAYLQRLGMDAVAAHDALMARVLREEAERRPYLAAVGLEAPDRAGIASLRIEGCPDLGEAARILSDAHGVMCRSGHQCAQPLVDRFAGSQVLRMSTYVYNTEGEVRAAFEALDATCAALGVRPGP